MSTSINTNSAISNPHKAVQRVSDVVRQAIATLGPVKPLSLRQRLRDRSTNSRFSDESLHQLIHAATNGEIAGIAFDPQQVTDTLATIDAGRALAHEMRTLSDGYEGVLLAQRAELCRVGQAAIDALAAKAKMRDEVEPLVRQVRSLKPRRTRAKKQIAAPVTPAPKG